MRNTAKKIFQEAGVEVAGKEDVFNRVVEILSETMAELSVANACGDITFGKRVELFDDQKASLVEELKEKYAANSDS